MTGRRFEALDELLDEALTLPVPGGDGTVREYRIPSPPAEDGLRIQRLMALAEKVANGADDGNVEVLDDDQEADLLRLCLGEVLEEMRADGVRWAWIKHAGLTAMFWITADADTAQKFWASGGDPSRLAPNRAARRASAGSSGGARSTRKRASTSGTKAPACSADTAAKG